MADEMPFAEFLQRMRTGDAGVIRAFVAVYEPFIRRSVRLRLRRLRLGTAADSVDICQSVLGSFLIRVAAGEYEITDRTSLEKLLLTIARNKLVKLARRENADRRDHNRLLNDSNPDKLADKAIPQPSEHVTGEDLFAAVRARLAPEELVLFEARQAGRSWDEIAAAGGDSPVVLRKRLSRALNRVAAELGLDDEQE